MSKCAGLWKRNRGKVWYRIESRGQSKPSCHLSGIVSSYMSGRERSQALKVIDHMVIRSCGRSGRRIDGKIRLFELHSLECSSLLLSGDSGIPSSDDIGGIVPCFVVIPELASWRGPGRSSWLSMFMEMVVSTD
jgi:hypothetical protein